jgi:hypothetical protein
MTIASIVHGLIIAEEALTVVIPEERWFGASAIDEANRPTPLFAVIRYGVRTRGMSNIHRIPLEIWVHDEPGSYGTINSVIADLRGTLDGVVHHGDSDGNELMSADWVSDSGDLYDPGYRTIVRNTSYNLIGQGV